jgi:hypothetical protein
MAMLEDVFVPIYLFHRYQIEAVKSGWWLILFLCRKGDGQMITRSVTKEEQLNALNAITDCIDPKVLEISENVLKLIPPRPAGYDYNREYLIVEPVFHLIRLQHEAAADIPLSFF